MPTQAFSRIHRRYLVNRQFISSSNERKFFFLWEEITSSQTKDDLKL
ncbi:MAG: hypothetical protein IPH28_25680 [Cytophagaceae bacterium]|nr:hypothetical protein [Cytophagaceae bacterium]